MDFDYWIAFPHFVAAPPRTSSPAESVRKGILVKDDPSLGIVFL